MSATQTMPDAPPNNSTNVRSSTQSAPDPTWLRRDWKLSLLRGSLRGLSAVSPRTAARVMDSLWFHAPRTRATGKARAVLAQGRAQQFEVHGRRVQAWAWGEGPTVVLLHGWGGNAGNLHAFVAPLCARGFRVVAFDAPSHGDSQESRRGGQRATFFEFSEALRVVTANEGPPAGVIAHSGGATAVGMALREGWPSPPRLVFLAPFAQPSAAVAPFARALGVSPEAVEHFEAGVRDYLGVTWAQVDLPALPASLMTGRLLVVHDASDRDVPVTHGEALADVWPGARFHLTHGLGHRRVTGDSFVVRRAVDFVST